MSYVKIGVAGPVGSGKTALIEALSRKMAGDYSIGVITNDIYTKEDAQFLAKNSVLPVERIIGIMERIVVELVIRIGRKRVAPASTSAVLRSIVIRYWFTVST